MRLELKLNVSVHNQGAVFAWGAFLIDYGTVEWSEPLVAVHLRGVAGGGVAQHGAGAGAASRATRRGELDRSAP